MPLILETSITPSLRPTFLPKTFSTGLRSFLIQPLIETLSITGKDWVRYRARANIFDVFKSSLFKSSRQKQFPTLSQPPESHLISNNVDMSDIRKGDAGFSYI
jgi:hypothetical protein